MLWKEIKTIYDVMGGGKYMIEETYLHRLNMLFKHLYK